MTAFNGHAADPMHGGFERVLGDVAVAEVYRGAREYGRTNRWDTPTVVRLRADDHLDGIHWRACPDCGGTGRFPVPDRDIDDFCVKCKGNGLEAVMA